MDFDDILKQVFSGKHEQKFFHVITNDPHVLFKEVSKPSYFSVCSGRTDILTLDELTENEQQDTIGFFIITHKIEQHEEKE